jgi:exopolysaccharide production protein ExoZ
MNGRIGNIQVLRGIAALLIVLYHLLLAETAYAARAFLLPDLLAYGACGVDFFFLISGYVLTARYVDRAGARRAAGTFLARRLFRIYPLYWVYSAVLLALAAFRPDLVDASVYAGVSIWRSFLLLPQSGAPLLSVAWALSHLVYFSCAFALLLVAGRRAVVPGLCAWALLVVAGYAWRGGSPALRALPWTHLVWHPLTLEFILGCVLALTVRRTRAAARTAAIGGACLLGAACLAWSAGHGTDLPRNWWRVLVFGVPGALILYGGAAGAPLRAHALSRALHLFGDASYSLYLSHTLVLSAVGRAWLAHPTQHPAAQAAWLGVMLAAALVFSLFSYRLLEQPLGRLERRTKPTPAPAGAGGGIMSPGGCR